MVCPTGANILEKIYIYIYFKCTRGSVFCSCGCFRFFFFSCFEEPGRKSSQDYWYLFIDWAWRQEIHTKRRVIIHKLNTWIVLYFFIFLFLGGGDERMKNDLKTMN